MENTNDAKARLIVDGVVYEAIDGEAAIKTTTEPGAKTPPVAQPDNPPVNDKEGGKEGVDPPPDFSLDNLPASYDPPPFNAEISPVAHRYFSNFDHKQTDVQPSEMWVQKDADIAKHGRI